MSRPKEEIATLCSKKPIWPSCRLRLPKPADQPAYISRDLRKNDTDQSSGPDQCCVQKVQLTAATGIGYRGNHSDDLSTPSHSHRASRVARLVTGNSRAIGGEYTRHLGPPAIGRRVAVWPQARRRQQRAPLPRAVCRSVRVRKEIRPEFSNGDDQGDSALDYGISPAVQGQTAPAAHGDAKEAFTVDVLRIVGDNVLDKGAVLSLWRVPREDRKSWSHAPEAYRSLGDRILRLGEPLLAYDVVCEGLECFPGDTRLRQLQGLALARSGAHEGANSVLERLYAEGGDDEETVGILAGTNKSLGLSTRRLEHGMKLAHLRRSRELYTEAYDRFGGYWTGVNAATLALLLHDEKRAKDLANRVREQCIRELERAKVRGIDSYWTVATLGEAALVLGELAEAEDWYGRASKLACRDGRYGDLTATRQQARRLLEHYGLDVRILDRCFQIPRVAVFAGHMVDRPGRSLPRFPPRLEGAVRAAIRARLEQSGVQIGYASAACGSDIIFLEEVLERGGEAHVVLPYDRDQFLADSVEVIPGSNWGERCRRILERAEVTTASHQRLAVGGISYDYSNMILHGLATLRADHLETELLALAVWDGRPGDGRGGTASTVGRWKSKGFAVDVIELTKILHRESPVLEASPASAPSVLGGGAGEPHSRFGSKIVSILFGDVVGFSKLTEPQVPHFVDHFLGLVAELLAGLPRKPLKKNTWGDGLYLVFESPLEAGRFALALQERVGAMHWEAVELPAGLGLRLRFMPDQCTSAKIR